MTRRSAFALLGTAAALPAPAQPVARKGRLKQCATPGCFGRMDPETIAREAARLGLKGIDLVRPQDWPILKKHGLLCTMSHVPMPREARVAGAGLNRKEAHAAFEPYVRKGIDMAAAEGMPNLIVLSGSRRGLSDEEGIANCAAFLNSVKAQAEDKGVTLCMELLNSKVDHPDYQADHTTWGVEVMKRVNSPRVKLLYDIYHMQIMEGDIIRTIRNNVQHIGHFHTAGVPGRHEIDAGQELNYRAICQAIVDVGFTGYLAHEYTPLRDPLKSLQEAIEICDV